MPDTSVPPAALALTLAPAFQPLAQTPRWVAWRTGLRGGRPTKIPFDPGAPGLASTGDPRTWGDAAAAQRRAAAMDPPGGIGLVLGALAPAGPVLAGLDLDTCCGGGALRPWAAAIVGRMGCYAEASPSGAGIKLFFTLTLAEAASLPGGKVWKQAGAGQADHPPAIELYTRGRYFAVTGAHLPGTPARLGPPSPGALRWLVDEAGPRFAGVPAQEATEAGQSPSTGQDQSRSGLAFRAVLRVRRAGASFADALGALRADPRTAAWLAEKGEPGNNRGLRRIWDKTGQIATSSQTAAPPANDHWQDGWQRGPGGEPRSNVRNALHALRHAPALAGLLGRDDMAHVEMLLKPMPAAGGAGQPAAGVAGQPAAGGAGQRPHAPRPIRDDDVTALQAWLQNEGLPHLTSQAAHGAAALHARANAYHPVRDYLRGLRWDGVPRLDGWLHHYLRSPDTPYARGIGPMMLVAMVARVMQPGCQADYMAVLEGPQGARKSTACKVLGGEWFSDSLPDLRSDPVRVSQHLRGRWVIEVSELSAMSRAGAGDLKAFITRRDERFLPKHARKEVWEPRQNVFIGTTNKPLYLRDETGGRRFWPVAVGAIDTDALRRDRDQLFAEACVRYRAGQQWWPDSAFEAEHVRPEQDARYEADAWEGPVAEFLAGRTRVTVLEVAVGALGVDKARLGRVEQLRVVACLGRAGWVRGERLEGGRSWVPGPGAG